MRFSCTFSLLKDPGRAHMGPKHQKFSSGPENCDIEPKVWFLASSFCLLRLGEPLAGTRGNPAGQSLVPAL